MSTKRSLPTSVVLVVEDDDFLRMNAVDMFKERGFAVVEACHADQAWEILETRPDIGVLFTDIDMLGSMCVLILAQRVFACWPDIHLVLTSGRHRLSDDEIPDHGLFVPKPYGTSEVVKAIHSAC